MKVLSAPPRSGPARWPLPPSCLRACDLDLPPAGARICVAGLVLVRQRPGTAKGVIFVTLEDETGTVNVVVWAKTYETYRRAVISGRLLRVTGRLQREQSVMHVIAEQIEDISALLDTLLDPSATPVLQQPSPLTSKSTPPPTSKSTPRA